MNCLRAIFVTGLCTITALAQGSADDYFRAIRADDLSGLRKLVKSGSADVRDKLEWTPLHYAALYGSTGAVHVLLEAGADPNARNKAEITPLIYGAWSFDRVRLLVEKGGNVNAKASDGSTPLWVALGAQENRQTVQYLIAKGADLKVVMSSGADYLMRAASLGDTELIRLLLAKGLDARRTDPAGFTALANTFGPGDGARVALLLAGSDVNATNTFAGKVKNGPIALVGLTPLMDAAPFSSPSSISAVLKAGAQANAIDIRKMTALMLAIATDRANPETVRRLLAAGVDVNAADVNGETALDWAQKYRNPEILAALQAAGARGRGLAAAPVKPTDYATASPGAAIEKASALLAASGEKFFTEGGGCVGCHHQPMAGRAFAAVQAAGLPAEPRLRRILVDGMIAERPRMLSNAQILLNVGGGYDQYLYAVAGMADMREPASATTDAIVHFVAESQLASGQWDLSTNRPPMQESNISRTMMAIYALKSYGWPARESEFSERVKRGGEWLLTARPDTTCDKADRLTGLWLAGLPNNVLRDAAQELLKEQRPDGGWAQTRFLDSDAYGTSTVLYALLKTGMLKVGDGSYQRGAAFLLKTQFPDGSWYVRSRAPKLQPYFQSAFPFNHDQWISASATAYAVMALAPGANRK